jgi:hypothetical protein
MYSAYIFGNWFVGKEVDFCTYKQSSEKLGE